MRGTKTCQMCGKPLNPKVHPNTKYCPSCRKEVSLAQAQEYHRRRTSRDRRPHNCIVCGEQLPEGTAPNQRYCFLCAQKVHLETARKYSKSRAARLKAEKNTPPKPAPKEKLSPGRHRKVDKPCKECGTMMYGVDPGKMFCEACKKRRYGKSSVDTGTLPGIVKPKEKPKTNHDLIVDDNAAAAAKGMSYGKFKEWQRRQKELKERDEIY